MHVEIKEVKKHDITTYDIYVIYHSHQIKITYFLTLHEAEVFKNGFIYGLEFNKLNNFSEDFKKKYIWGYKRELINDKE